MLTNKNQKTMARNNSNRGFASMDRDERRSISSMGGRASHEGQQNYRDDDREDYDDDDYDNDYENTSDSYDDDYRDEEDYDDNDRDYQRDGGSGRGFASMDRDEVRRIASMGGRASHGGRG